MAFKLEIPGKDPVYFNSLHSIDNYLYDSQNACLLNMLDMVSMIIPDKNTPILAVVSSRKPRRIIVVKTNIVLAEGEHSKTAAGLIVSHKGDYIHAEGFEGTYDDVFTDYCHGSLQLFKAIIAEKGGSQSDPLVAFSVTIDAEYQSCSMVIFVFTIDGKETYYEHGEIIDKFGRFTDAATKIDHRLQGLVTKYTGREMATIFTYRPGIDSSGTFKTHCEIPSTN
jgi:hypothetical protein